MDLDLDLSTCWMSTLSGRRFNPFDDEPDFELRDLVWGVARAPRFAGQFREEVEHYSVAEHTVVLTRWLMAMAPGAREEARCMATHDLTEGLLQDMVKPIKRHDAFYQQMEAKFDSALARRYGLHRPMPAVVKLLDRRIMVDERMQVMNPSSSYWWSRLEGIEPLGVRLEFWRPRKAAEELFALLEELDVRD